MGNQGTIGYTCPLTGEARSVPAGLYQDGQPLPIAASAEEIFKAAGLDWRKVYQDAEAVEAGFGIFALRSQYKQLKDQLALPLDP